jgi:small conductance mechanosensitive channel
MPLPLPFLVPSNWQEWRAWLQDSGPSVAGIIVGLVLVRLLFHRVVGRVVRSAVARAVSARREDPVVVQRRAHTLLSTLDWAFTIFLFLVGTALVLDQLDIRVSALIAGVSIVGIAVGLGAQTLIKDVINGLFIIIEGQYAVGDTVTVAGLTGEVIDINPRRTVLRDTEGNVHSIPNSAITTATNRTGSLNRIVVEFDVPFAESERAAEVAGAVAREVTESNASRMLIPLGLASQKAAPGGKVRLQVAGGARPQERWEVEAQLRHCLQERFAAAHLDVQFGEGSAGPADAG